MSEHPYRVHPEKTKAPAASVNWRYESRHQGLGTAFDATAPPAGTQSSLLGAPMPKTLRTAHDPHVCVERVFQRGECRDVAPRLTAEHSRHRRVRDIGARRDATHGLAGRVEVVTQAAARRLHAFYVRWGVVAQHRIGPAATRDVAGCARCAGVTHAPHFARNFGVVGAYTSNGAHEHHLGMGA